jgi:DedD protein
LEQQAKERLTGGVILVILLVLLVPELLTGPRGAPPPPPAQPDQAPMRSYTMDLGESPHANSAPVAASTAVAPASQPAPANRAPVPDEATTAPQTAAAESEPPPAPPMTDVAQRAVAAPKVVTTPKPSPAREPEHAAATWTVQLGTFSSRENALHLVANLKSHGFNGSVLEATKSGHKLFRVRVGSEHDRAAAQKLAARLKAAGEKGGEVVPR